jgi:uncharacterized protein
MSAMAELDPGPAPQSEADSLTDSAAAAPTTAIGPVQQTERYVVMDVLRGFALFGVLAANMRSFNLPLDIYTTPEKLFSGRADVWAQALLDIFISGKFYALFAFLFGLGFAIQTTRAAARNSKFPWFYLRRLAGLATMGLIHGIFIWNGDILFAYSIGGFWLFWFRKARRKTIARWIFSVWGLFTGVVIAAWVAAQFGSKIGIGGVAPIDWPAVQQEIAVYAHSHLLGIIHETALQWFGGKFPGRGNSWQWLGRSPLQDFALGTLSVAIFLVGLWVWRSGLLEHLDERRGLLRRICAWTLPLGIAMNIVSEAHSLWIDHHPAAVHPGVTLKPTVIALLLQLIAIYGAPVLTCGYATGITLLFLSRKNLVLWLAPLGRMALTNYLMQSVICVAFFSGIITGLYGRVGPAWDMVATLILYFAQVFFSRWWLGRFRYGPMEYLWRAVTYLRWPEMR